MLEVSLHEDDYHSTTILTDEMTLEGIASFVKLFTEISGNQRMTLKLDGEKFKPNKKYLYEKNIRRVPSEIKSKMRYYIVARGSKSYNIYTFDDIRFLSGIYIGIGFCKEDYSYIIRGIGETNLKIVEKEEREDREDRESRTVQKRKKDQVNVKSEENKSIEKEDEVQETESKTEDPERETVTSNEEIKSDEVNESNDEKKETNEETEEKKNIVLTKRSPKFRMSPKRSSKKKVTQSAPQNLSLLSITELKVIAKNENIDIENLSKKTEIVEKIKEKLGD
jgi:hypothetical protein